MSRFGLTAVDSRRIPLAAGLAATVLFALACASTRERVFTAATNDTVVARTEASYGGEGVAVIVTNSSTQDIVVTGFRLTECENVKNRCEVKRMRMRVPAGQSSRIATIERDNPSRAYTYRYSWSWEVSSSVSNPD